MMLERRAEANRLTVKNSIEQTFVKCGKKGEKALLVYLCIGYPDFETSYKLALEVIDSGADIVEFGIPFSDPLADGPVLQLAAKEALEKGTKVRDIFVIAERLKSVTNNPLIAMTYYNPVFRFGVENFCGRAAVSGLDGLIVPDLPYEESGRLSKAAAGEDLGFIPLAAPTSTPERLNLIAGTAEGFIYCVSSTGTTGGDLNKFQGVRDMTGYLRKVTSKPVAVGFGISGPEQVRKVSEHCDGVIVGSAVARTIEQNKSDPENCLREVGCLVKNIKKACN